MKTLRSVRGLSLLCLTTLCGCKQAPPLPAPVITLNTCQPVSQCTLSAMAPLTNGDLNAALTTTKAEWAACAAKLDMIVACQKRARSATSEHRSMNKPASLRRALTAAIPSLEAEPDKLAVFLDEGSIVATGTRSLSFEYRYTAHALVMDFAGDADTVFVALVEWVRTNQPDLVTNPDEAGNGIAFEVDILNHTSVDISIKLALTESVVVTTEPNGSRVIEHVDDREVGAAEVLTWVAQPWTN